MAGRNPRPINLSKLNGDRRALARNNVELPLSIPVAPMWLTAEAKDEWDQIVPVLVRMRVLTEADQIALGLLADYMARWKDMSNKIKQHGYLMPVKNRHGGTVWKRSPFVSMHLEFGIIVQRLLSQFGLTPSARARLNDGGKTETQNILFSRTAYTAESD